MTRHALFVGLCAALCGPSGAARAESAAPAVHVDPRVELLCIVYHLAGDEAYAERARSAYRADVDAHFASYGDEPVVRLVRRLGAERGITYDAPMSLAMFLDPVTLAPTRPLKTMPPGLDDRWKGVDTDELVAELQAFAKKTDQASFHAAHRAYFATVEERFADFVEKHAIASWLDAATGVPAHADFTIVPGLLTGRGSYGLRATPRGGQEQRAQIVAIENSDDADLPRPTFMTAMLLVHETAHSYVNALVKEMPRSLVRAADALLAKRRSKVVRQYTSGEVLVDESLVRALTDRYLREKFSAATADEVIRTQDVSQGFTWMKPLVSLLDEYETDRTRYPDLRAFAPRLEAFFTKLASR